jgi:hypothetical protein
MRVLRGMRALGLLGDMRVLRGMRALNLLGNLGGWRFAGI